MPSRPEQQPETTAERAARWAAESASTKPRSRFAGLAGALALRLVGGSIVVGLLGALAYGMIAIIQRSEPGDHTSAGWVTASTCFADDPNDFFTDDETLGELPTVDCEEAHRAEAYLGFELGHGRPGSSTRQCAREWAAQSDIPVEVSGIELTRLVKPSDGLASDRILCVAVGPESVTGRELKNWRP